MSERIRVASVEEVERTGKKVVEVQGVEIGIRKIENQYYAFLNNCPHQNGPVAEGQIKQRVTAEKPEIGERIEHKYDEDTTVIRCPLHGWGFDIETGQHMGVSEDGPTVPTFDVTIEDGDIYIEN